MDRRDFLKGAVATGASLTTLNSAPGAEAQNVKPLPRQVRWQDFELGLVYHFDLDVYMPGGHHHERLVAMYDGSVGRNANLILGAVPNADGLIPEADLNRYAALGREIRRRFDQPTAQTNGAGATVELRLARPARIDSIIMMEDIRHGERIRRYVVEGLVAGDTWRHLCDGTSVGHKRIQQFDATEAAAVRLKAIDSVATPVIRRLAVYDTSHM